MRKKKYNYKKYLPSAILLLAAVVLFFNLKIGLPTGNNNAAQKLNQTSMPANGATLKIFLSDGRVRVFQGQINPGTTLVEVLYFVSLKGVELKYAVDKKETATLMSFAGINNIGMKTWHFYVNGKAVKTSEIAKTIIKPKDLIEAKLE
jgi:hypothetical protein